MPTHTAPEILFLQQEDVVLAGATDMAKALREVEQALTMTGRGDVIQPAKTVLEFPDPESGQRRYLAVSMPAHLGEPVHRTGIKWAAESLDNVQRGDLPYGIDLIILHDLQRACPVAIMDGTIITAVRTGAAAGVAARHLARPDSRTAAFIGAGVIGRTALEAIALALPGLQELRLFDLNRAKAEALAAEFAGRWPVNVVQSVEAAVTGADVIATMTTTRTPFIQAGWLKPGCFVAAIGKNEFEAQALLDADRLVVDNWEQFKHYPAAMLTRLYQEGKIADRDITNLPDILVGRVPGRQSPEERIHFLSFGLACEDLIIAERVYRQAVALDLGQKLSLWKKPLWM
ncbi:MAG: ornithine cyclodeaminase family protein [Chloroflexi bacterium]|nr:MAG: ornithine cyclodeaminase family protein [Chloroflexota bacterium]